jgi:hypothetical protein
VIVMKTAALVLVSFLAVSSHDLARGADAPAPSRKTADGGCPATKIRFTKETGCRNDGYVEFCVPAADKKLRAAIKRIAPTAENKGEQRCDDKELLFFLPVDEESGACVERRGAMTDKAWRQVCALARLPQIASIRPVVFE